MSVLWKETFSSLYKYLGSLIRLYGKKSFYELIVVIELKLMTQAVTVKRTGDDLPLPVKIAVIVTGVYNIILVRKIFLYFQRRII